MTKEHSLSYNEHSYSNNLKGNLTIYLNIIKNNPHIKNIQLINVSNDFYLISTNYGPSNSEEWKKD